MIQLDWIDSRTDVCTCDKKEEAENMSWTRGIVAFACTGTLNKMYLKMYLSNCMYISYLYLLCVSSHWTGYTCDTSQLHNHENKVSVGIISKDTATLHWPDSYKCNSYQFKWKHFPLSQSNKHSVLSSLYFLHCFVMISSKV